MSLRVGTFYSGALPAAAGGVPPYTYSLECPTVDGEPKLPSGMGFAPGTRTFAGVPDESFRDTCTYTVEDSAGDTVSHAVEVEVETDELTLPVLPKVTIHVRNFHSQQFPAAAGGVPPYTYSLECPTVDGEPKLPSGMGFAPGTRTFAGVPDESFRDTCTYTVEDSAGDTVSHAVEVEVKAVRGLELPPVRKVRLVVGRPSREEFPEARGGVAPYNYSFTCDGGALPLGMRFSPSSRSFSGTPRAQFADSCTYTVTDRSQPPATASITVEVEVTAETLTFVDSVPSIPALSVGRSFNSRRFPATMGGVAPYNYSFTCDGGALPPGMRFSSRTFSGRPSVPFRDSCTYKATDSSQPPATVSGTVGVVVEGDPESLELPDDVVSGNEISLEVGERYQKTLPGATGGTLPYTYSFGCDQGVLPYELSFEEVTRVLEGTVRLPFAEASCTYAVADRSQPPAEVSRTVTVVATGTVEPLGLPDNVVSGNELPLEVGKFYGVTLAAAAGGVPPYTYSFACDGGALPSGMSFDPASHRFSGTPRARFDDSCTYAVEDHSPQGHGRPSERVERTVSVTVTDPRPRPPLELPSSVVLGNSVVLTAGQPARVTFEPASGGVPPYTYELACVPDLQLEACDADPREGLCLEGRVLSGTPSNALAELTCTYEVTDRNGDGDTIEQDFTLAVSPRNPGSWRFNPRTLGGSEYPVNPTVDGRQPLATLPRALGGTRAETYELLDVRGPLGFDSGTRQLFYVHPGVPPLLGTRTTSAYQVVVDGTPQDALCVDVVYLNPIAGVSRTVRVSARDGAHWNGTDRFVCVPEVPAGSTGSLPMASNPVHEALGPIHARRAVDVAHASVRDRVRGWSPGAAGTLSAFSPAVDFGSLSGESGGFDYSGSSTSMSAGAELGAGAWQTGLVASFTRTELRYDAEAGLAERGYRAGEHDTEIVSLHPFVAWHAPSGRHLWASLGGGAGNLRHRDDLGFRSRSNSDVRLLAYAMGGSVPVTDLLSGELHAEAGIESFAFKIKGGDRISSALPTLRGHDYRAGLAWSTPVLGAPSVSVAYEYLTGDGPEGGRVDGQGSLSFDGVFDPRLTLTASAQGSFGLGDYEHKLWSLGGGFRFAPDDSGRGFGLDLDARLMSMVGGGSANLGMRSEAGYGLWGGPFLGTVRPYVSVVRYSSDHAVRRALGLDLGGASNWRVKIEAYDDSAGQPLAFKFTLRHSF